MKRSGMLLAGFLGAVIAVPAGAFDLSESSTQSKLYVNFAFGGAGKGLSSLHYGFRMDRAHTRADDFAPPLLVADFNSKGFGETFVAGLPVGSMLVKLSQDGEQPAAEGGDAAPAAEDKPWYNPTGWGWIPWTVVGVVVVGGGYFLLTGDDDSEPSGNGGGGSNGNNDTGGGDICVVEPLCVPTDLPIPFTGSQGKAYAYSITEFDVGTGQMGDLIAR